MRNKIHLFLLLCVLGSSCCLAKTGELSKNSQKNYKKVCKQFNKEGWKVFDKALSLDDALMQYFIQLENSADSVIYLVTTGQARNVNLAYSQAKHHASVEQASKIGIYVKGSTNFQMFISSESKSFLRNTTFTHVEQTIRSLSPALSLYRTLKDGTTEINLYYLIK